MAHRFSFTLAAVGIAAISGITALAQTSARTPDRTADRTADRTTASGVYSAAQAERGADAYARRCARCHGENLDGVGAGPMLYSSRFLDRWREDSLSTLHDYIVKNMPADNTAGTLSEAEYLDILAYLLSANDLPAGTAALEAKDLSRTLLVGADGPKPLPPATTVRVVGCLAQAGTGWSLAHASAPARVRNGDTTDPAELAASAQVALGTQSFRLPNASDDHPAAQLTAQLAKKVQVKGVLNGEGETARISVLSLEPLNQPCTQ